jgi:hypothetical protein
MELDYMALSVPTLRNKLQAVGLILPSNTKKQQLVKLYEQHILPGQGRNNGRRARGVTVPAVSAIDNHTVSSVTATSKKARGRPPRQGPYPTPNVTNRGVNITTDGVLDAMTPMEVEPNFRAEISTNAASAMSRLLTPDEIAQSCVSVNPPTAETITLQAVMAELRSLKDAVKSMSLTQSQVSLSTTADQTPAVAPSVRNVVDTGSILTASMQGALPSTKNPDVVTLNPLLSVSDHQMATSANLIPSPNDVITTIYDRSGQGQSTGRFGAMPGTGRFGVPADSLPPTETISPTLRQKIIAGKDVNLALLLSPDPVSERVVDSDGDTFVLRSATDPRTTKTLTISEFITAFTRYTNVMTEVYPHRREELNLYMSEIVSQSARFGGSLFYEYHKLFSANAASKLERNVKIDWSTRSHELYTACFSGTKAISCHLCSSIDHISKFCPKQIAGGKQQASSFASNARQGTGDRPRKQLHDGVEICFNFNGFGCSRGEACKYAHVCMACKGKHSKRKCFSKGENKGAKPEDSEKSRK